MQFFKRIILIARNNGILIGDPFANYKIRLEKVDRGYLTEDEIKIILKKKMVSERLEQVRDVFIFSCFSGLAYVDVANLKEDNIRKSFDGNLWIITKRQKTNTDVNVPLLDIPKMILEKYKGKLPNGKVLPIISNQKLNAYLKEIADVCGIKKNLTFHMARHRRFYKHQIINRLNWLSIKIGNDKETSEFLYSTLFCHFKEPLCLLQR